MTHRGYLTVAEGALLRSLCRKADLFSPCFRMGLPMEGRYAAKERHRRDLLVGQCGSTGQKYGRKYPSAIGAARSVRLLRDTTIS